MNRSDISVSVHAPIRLSTEELKRGDLVECVCKEVNELTKRSPHIAWVEVDERDRQDDGSAEIRITMHRCCGVERDMHHAYRVHRIATGRYRIEPL